MVEHVTINSLMESKSLAYPTTVAVLEKVADSDVEDQFAPANDEVIQYYIDYHTYQNQRGIISFSIFQMTYGAMLIASIFTDNRIFLYLTGGYALTLLISEIYFISQTMLK